jgi:hypothetical protein
MGLRKEKLYKATYSGGQLSKEDIRLVPGLTVYRAERGFFTDVLPCSPQAVHACREQDDLLGWHAMTIRTEIWEVEGRVVREWDDGFSRKVLLRKYKVLRKLPQNEISARIQYRTRQNQIQRGW